MRKTFHCAASLFSYDSKNKYTQTYERRFHTNIIRLPIQKWNPILFTYHIDDLRCYQYKTDFKYLYFNEKLALTCFVRRIDFVCARDFMFWNARRTIDLMTSLPSLLLRKICTGYVISILKILTCTTRWWKTIIVVKQKVLCSSYCWQFIVHFCTQASFICLNANTFLVCR